MPMGWLVRSCGESERECEGMHSSGNVKRVAVPLIGPLAFTDAWPEAKDDSFAFVRA